MNGGADLAREAFLELAEELNDPDVEGVTVGSSEVVEGLEAARQELTLLGWAGIGEDALGGEEVCVDPGVLRELVDTAHGDLERLVTVDGIDPEDDVVEELAAAVDEAEAALEEADR